MLGRILILAFALLCAAPASAATGWLLCNDTALSDGMSGTASTDYVLTNTGTDSCRIFYTTGTDDSEIFTIQKSAFAVFDPDVDSTVGADACQGRLFMLQPGQNEKDTSSNIPIPTFDGSTTWTGAAQKDMQFIGAGLYWWDTTATSGGDNCTLTINLVY